MLKEELEKARAAARKLEAEMGETKRELADAKKRVAEQAVAVKAVERAPAKKEESKSDLMVVVYLPSKIEERGLLSVFGIGSSHGTVTWTLRRLALGVQYPEIERQLLNVQLTHPRGDWKISSENNKKWREVLNRFLVDEDTMYYINGGRNICSARCYNEEEMHYENNKY